MIIALAAMALIHPVAVEAPPVCETVTVQENSGNGPNYPIKLCGDKALPVHSLIVDGSKLPEKNTTHKVVVFWSSSNTDKGSVTDSINRCTYHYDWKVVFAGSPQYAQGDWETVCGDSMQIMAECYTSAANSYYYRKSGHVTGLEVIDRATCYSGDSIVAGYIAIDGGTWHRFWQK